MGLVAGSRKTTHAHQTSDIFAAQTLLYFFPVPVKERVSDETTLIRRCVKGDVDAYGVFVDRYGSRIINVALMIVGDRHEAEDIAQEAFIRAFRGLAGFRGKSRFSSWLHQIALNLCRDHLKKRARGGGPVPMSEETLEGSADGREIGRASCRERVFTAV